MPVHLTELPNASPRLSSFVPHGSISIVGNAAFASQGWPGNGSQQSPYIIEGLEITSDDSCIAVFNTNAHFIIRNCILSSQTNELTNCVRLSHVSNGAIENCTISSSDIGIMLIADDNCILVNNSLTECGRIGILLSSGENCILSDNRVANCAGYGFRLSYLENSILENNCILNCGEMGIGFQYSQNVTVADNVVTDSGRYGLYIALTANCTFVNNTLENGGIGVEGDKQHWIHDFSGNVVNGKSFGYFPRVNDTEIDGSQFGQVFLIDCFNVSLSSGVFSNASVGPTLLSCLNCTISDMELRGNLYGINLLESENTALRNNTLIGCGIRFDGTAVKYWTITETGNTVNGEPFGYYLNQDDLVINGNNYGQLVLVDSEYLSVENGTFDSVTVGMAINSCFNCSIRNVLSVDNYDEGIRISNSRNCTLNNVTIEDCHNEGLYITVSDNTTVTESKIQRNGQGIKIFTSDDCIVDSSQILESQGDAIYLVNTSYGIIKDNLLHDNMGPLELYVVNYLEIVNNTISGSSSDGLYLDFTSGVRIFNNRIYGNVGYGLSLGVYTLFSEIYNNMIGFNEAGNALDGGFYNEWDDGVGTGNVWSDYSGAGAYSVSGMGVDNYPRGFLSRPVDVWYFVGASVPSVTWDVRLPNPDSYTILWNGVVIAQGSLNSSLEHLSKSIGGMPVGIYSLTLVVVDGMGYSLVDTITITVFQGITTITTTTTATSSTTASTTTPPDMTMIVIIVVAGAVGGVAGIAVILLMVASRKREAPT